MDESLLGNVDDVASYIFNEGELPATVIEDIPERSKQVYIVWWKRYVVFKTKDGKAKPDQMSTVMEFFSEMMKIYAPATLWQAYGCLNTIYQSLYEVNFNAHPKLKKKLKKLFQSCTQKKSKVFTKEELQKYYDTAPHTGKHLLNKAVASNATSGGLRISEVVATKFEDLTYADKKSNITAIISVETKTQAPNVHSYIVPMTESKRSPAQNMLDYIDALNLSEKERKGRLFRSYDERNSKFSKRPLGKNTAAKIPFEIATFLGLPNPELYTGHAFRRSAATILADEGATVNQLKRFGRWKSDTVCASYVDNSKKARTDAAMMLAGPTTNQPATQSKSIEFKNCSNVVVHLG